MMEDICKELAKAYTEHLRTLQQQPGTPRTDGSGGGDDDSLLELQL